MAVRGNTSDRQVPDISDSCGPSCAIAHNRLIQSAFRFLILGQLLDPRPVTTMTPTLGGLPWIVPDADFSPAA